MKKLLSAVAVILTVLVISVSQRNELPCKIGENCKPCHVNPHFDRCLK